MTFPNIEAIGRLLDTPQFRTAETDDGELAIAEVDLAVDLPSGDDEDKQIKLSGVTLYGEDAVALGDLWAEGLEVGDALEVESPIYPNDTEFETDEGETISVDQFDLRGAEVEQFEDWDNAYFPTVSASGNLTSEPELQEADNGTKYLNATLAADTASQDDESLFMDFVAFGDDAEKIAGEFGTDDLIEIEGTPKSEDFPADDGNVHVYKHALEGVSAEEVDLDADVDQSAEQSADQGDRDNPFADAEQNPASAAPSA